MKKLVVVACVALGASLAATTANAEEGCSPIGSWYGYYAPGDTNLIGPRWISTISGASNSSGALTLELNGGYDYTLTTDGVPWFPTAVAGTLIRGTWKRIGGNKFATSSLAMVRDEGGNTVYIDVRHRYIDRRLQHGGGERYAGDPGPRHLRVADRSNATEGSLRASHRGGAVGGLSQAPRLRESVGAGFCSSSRQVFGAGSRHLKRVDHFNQELRRLKKADRTRAATWPPAGREPGITRVTGASVSGSELVLRQEPPRIVEQGDTAARDFKTARQRVDPAVLRRPDQRGAARFRCTVGS